MLPPEPEPPSFTDAPGLSPWIRGQYHLFTITPTLTSGDWLLSALGHFGRLTRGHGQYRDGKRVERTSWRQARSDATGMDRGAPSRMIMPLVFDARIRVLSAFL